MCLCTRVFFLSSFLRFSLLGHSWSFIMHYPFLFLLSKHSNIVAIRMDILMPAFSIYLLLFYQNTEVLWGWELC